MSSRQALAARHLARKVTHTVSRNAGLPSDLLTSAAIDTRYCGGTGFPEGDSVAYEPTQGLLAVGTSDGRVVLMGRPGVEATLRSASRAPTQHLAFLPHKGGLLRVTQDGDIQLFSAVSRRLLTSTWLQGDAINAVAPLPPGAGPSGAAAPGTAGSDAYVLLGCESGSVRVVAVLDESGAPAAGASPAADLALQPYQVLAQEVDGKGSVVGLSVALLQPDRPLLLLVHRRSGAVVWDIRAERVLCLALEDEGEGESSLPTCACWVGDRAHSFAVGYADGSILVFGVPQEALHPDPFTVVEPPDATLLLALRVAGRGVQAGPVRSLSFLPGGAGAGGAPGSRAEDCLLVFGGQGKEDPDMLTLLPLVAQQPGEGGGRQVPWFGSIKGFCTMPADGSAAAGSAGRARGLMILTEGGQLVVHDLQRWQPTPLTLPIQELPPITVARLVPCVSAALLRDGSIVAGGAAAVPSPQIPGSGQPSPSPRGGEPLGSASSAAAAQQGPQHGLTLDRVRACSRWGGADAPPPPPDHWPFTGGVPAASLAGIGAKRHPSALYFTGHRDGRVRVWDATTQVPELLLTVPATAGQERLRAVTALEVCPFSGLVMVGHQGGDARLYQFSDSQQAVHRINIDETLMPYEHVAVQPAGFQYVLRYSTHSADITSVSLATKLKLAAVADEAGTVSLLDLLQPAQLFSTRALAQPVAHAVFGSHVIPGVKEEPDVERVVLFLAGADSSLCMIGLDSGEPIGHSMKPKNASRPLALALLDATGIPLPLLHGQLLLAWANNNAAGGAAVAAQQALSEGSGAGGAAARVARLSLSERAPSSQSPLPPAGMAASGRRSTGADSHRSWSRAESEPDTERENSVEVHELPSDDDLDSHLAAAAQAADEERRQRSKFKLPKAFQGIKPRQADGTAGAGVADADLPHSPSSSNAWAARPAGGETAAPGGAFDPVGALQDFYGGAASPPLSPGQPSPSASGRGGAAAAGSGELLSDADLVDYVYLVDGDPSPATYVLLACADYLRVYTSDNVRLGDRSTERKASFEAPLCFAAPFMSTSGPGVASVDASDALQVHSLPGLEVLCRKQLEDSRVLGFRWACAAAPAVGGAPAGPPVAAGAACCSMDGQLVLASAGNELARLALIEDCALPAAPPAVYDMKLAAAAAAAGRRGGSALGGYPPRLEPPAAGAQVEGGDAGAAFSPLAAAAAAGKGFGRFLDHAATTVTGLATSAADTVKQELQRLGGAEGGSSRSLPSLQALFATPVEAEGDDDIDYMAEDEDLASSPVPPAGVPAAVGAGSMVASTAAPSAAAAAPAPAARKLVSPREAAAKLGPAAAKLKGLLPGARARSERAELLERDAAAAGASGSQSARGAGAGAGASAAGWAAAGRGPPVNRDADAIKRAYGRPGGSTAKAAGDVRSIMEQNRDMLAERGERLRNLDERSAQMSNDAGDFASMAKQLADQYANRKWYQL